MFDDLPASNSTPKKDKPKRNKIKVYHWNYDDDSVGYVLYRSSKKAWSGPVECSKRELEEKYPPQSSEDSKTEWEHLTINSGLDFVTKDSLPKRDDAKGKAGLIAIKSLLESCGSDSKSMQTMITLFSSVLSGYCARVSSDYYPDYISPKEIRAPIITIDKRDNTFQALEQITQSLAMPTNTNTSENVIFAVNPTVQIEYSPILSGRQADLKITDIANLRLSIKDAPELSVKRVLPQYRDTAVLVDCRCFPAKQISAFIQRNRWISIVLIAAPKGKLRSDPINVDGSVLARFTESWDQDAVHYLVGRFIRYLLKKVGHKRKWAESLKEYFKTINQKVIRYNSQELNPAVKGTKHYHTTLQMLALMLFVYSLADDEAITVDEAVDLLTEWYNVLLPGCCLKGNTDEVDKAEEMSKNEPESLQSQLEKVILNILQVDDGQHICYVPKGGFYPTSASDSDDVQYWGYVKIYEPKKEEPFLSLQFRWNNFQKLFTNYYPEYEGNSLIKEVQSLGLDYISETTKLRMYMNEGDKGRTTNGIMFIIEKMDFLPSEILERLKNLEYAH